ncbi:hypothetical protein As57867_013537, partial [Aphanomyces stellatus]
GSQYICGDDNDHFRECTSIDEMLTYLDLKFTLQAKYKSPNGDRWQMKDHYYMERVTQNGVTVDILNLDTNNAGVHGADQVCCQCYGYRWKVTQDPSVKTDPCLSATRGNILCAGGSTDMYDVRRCQWYHIFIRYELQKCMARIESWVQASYDGAVKDLAASTADWKIVNTHYSPHFHMTPAQMDKWYNLTSTFKLHAWFNGHTHGFAHDISTWNTHFYTNGAGGGIFSESSTSVTTTTKVQTKWSAAGTPYGYLEISFTQNWMKVQFVSFDKSWSFKGFNIADTVKGGIGRGHCWFVPKALDSPGVACKASGLNVVACPFLVQWIEGYNFSPEINRHLLNRMGTLATSHPPTRLLLALDLHIVKRKPHAEYFAHQTLPLSRFHACSCLTWPSHKTSLLDATPHPSTMVKLCPGMAPINYAKAKQDYPDIAYAIEAVESKPIATWYTDRSDYLTEAATTLTACTQTNGNLDSLPVFVVYGLPNKDCHGSYSAGGANKNANDYATFVAQLASAVGKQDVLYVLEPDAIGLLAEGPDQCGWTNNYLPNLKTAVQTLTQTNPSAQLYLDVGWWILNNATRLASLVPILDTLSLAGPIKGIVINTSNYRSNAELLTWCQAFVSATAGASPEEGVCVADVVMEIGRNMKCIFDTSRNYHGASPSGEWCNAKAAGIGLPPTDQTGSSLVDYYLWLKTPGQSDGTCAGQTVDSLPGPAAGDFFYKGFCMMFDNGYFVDKGLFPKTNKFALDGGGGSNISGAVVGAIIGGIVGVAAVALAIGLVVKKMRASKQEAARQKKLAAKYAATELQTATAK